MTVDERSEKVFRAHFGRKPALVATAPGRVNLIGDHTDYNGGFVLPCAIDRKTAVAAAPRHDNTINVVASDVPNGLDSFAIDRSIEPSVAQPWSNYVRGMTWAFCEVGLRPAGADIAIAGDVPIGSGLSSSASLEMTVGLAIAELSGFDIERKELARVGQRAENEFVGVSCGIMDQLASVLSVAGHALLLDCRSLDHELVPIPEDVTILIVDSNIRRGLVSSDYNARKGECDAAAQALGLVDLREADGDSDQALIASLAEPLNRRARHVVTENRRTLDAAEALRDGDIERVAALMYESHESLRSDFEVSVPGLDRIVEIVHSVVGEAGGARMTGAGFGGCVVAVVPGDSVADVLAAIERAGLQPESSEFVARPSAGAMLSQLTGD